MAETDFASIGEVDGYPYGLPEEYRPMVDEMRREGYSVPRFHTWNYGKSASVLRKKQGAPDAGVILFDFWMEEDRGVACQYDIRYSPWWKSVLERQNIEANGATPGVHVQWPQGCVDDHEYRAEQERKNKGASAMLDAIQRKRMLDALERLSTAKSDEDQRVAANEIAKEKRLQDSFDEMVFVVATGKTPEQYTAEQVRAAQKDIEAATEMNDVPLGEKLEDLAAFEIHTLDERGLITVSHKIYADGRTEGFPPASLIINRIPSLEAAAFSRGNRWKS